MKKGFFFLILASMIWGFAFVSQSIGAEYVGPFTFLAVRNWIASAVLLPVVCVMVRMRAEKGIPTGAPANRRQRRIHIAAGAACGAALFLAAGAQQIGIGWTTTAKAGFITAMYVVIVPVMSFLMGRRSSPSIWICVLLAIMGLYLLCMKPGEPGFGRGDMIILVSAFLFSIQILTVNCALQFVDAVRLSLLEMFFTALFATVCMLLFEHPTRSGLYAALPSLLYAGVMSSGVAYTLQIVGQEELDPAVASLIMCLESVFAVLGGWLILHQSLNARELCGCVLMFAALVLSQLPPGFLRRSQ